MSLALEGRPWVHLVSTGGQPWVLRALGPPEGAPWKHRGTTLDPQGRREDLSGRQWDPSGRQWEHLRSTVGPAWIPGGTWGTHGSTLRSPGDHVGAPGADRSAPGSGRGVTMDSGGGTGGIRVCSLRSWRWPGADRVRTGSGPGREGGRGGREGPNRKSSTFCRNAKICTFSNF